MFFNWSRQSRRARFAIGVAALLLARASDAPATEPLEVVRLAWVRADGAEACLSERELAERVRVRLGRDPFSEKATTLVEGFVRRDGAKLRATVRVRKASSEDASAARELESDELDCNALGNAVTLAVALAIDPEKAMAPPEEVAPPPPVEPKPPEPPPAVTPPVRPPPEQPRPKPEPQPRPERRGDVLVRAVLSSGVLPNWAPGAGMVGDYRFLERIGAFAAFTYLPEVRTDAGRASFGLTAGSLGGCYSLLQRERDALDVCLGVEVGALHSVVHAETPNDAGDRPWVAGVALLRGSMVLVDPLLLELGLGAGLPVIRHRFVVKGESGALFRPSPVVGQGFAGIGVIF